MGLGEAEVVEGFFIHLIVSSYIRKVPNARSVPGDSKGAVAKLSEIAVRVSEGAITPSSHSLAVAYHAVACSLYCKKIFSLYAAASSADHCVPRAR